MARNVEMNEPNASKVAVLNLVWLHGWQDFASFSFIFLSYQYDGRVIMKRHVHLNLVCVWKDFRLQPKSNPGR